MTDLVDPPLTPPPPLVGNILGFDPGKRKTGVAVGNTRLQTATPITTWRIASAEWTTPAFAIYIEPLLREWKPVAIVVGMATAADGAVTAQQQRSRTFAESLAALSSVSSIPIYFVDERLSSHMAAERLRALPKKSQSVGLDAIAAALIIETYFSDNAMPVCTLSGKP